MITLLLHIQNAEPVKVDVEELPGPTDVVIIGRNVRDRTDREVNWVEDGVKTVLIPWWRITYVEVMPSAGEEDEFPMPFRND
jgi:hypothetical protein